ncbi:MAG: hypothetical protein COY68_00955 [Candidatus Levybacteria bacterium CG_4_10_14_0_8_um_filter_35_23]|nr:MAG: hypothetical protein COY68_00955 [Candidatus Levybacteria bacterium CG_4_10_14_0_8_um_filter_35_23]
MNSRHELHNPREIRASIVPTAKVKQVLDLGDFEKDIKEIWRAEDSRKTSNFYVDWNFASAENTARDKQRAEWTAHMEDVFTDYATDKSQRLNTEIIFYSALYPERPETSAVSENVIVIHDLMKDFETEVWFDSGLQRQVLKTKAGGFSFVQDDLSALVCNMAGRTMITLRDTKKNAMVTFITASSEKKHEMEIKSVDATAPDAISLIDQIMQLNREGKMQFSPDSQISVI